MQVASSSLCRMLLLFWRSLLVGVGFIYGIRSAAAAACRGPEVGARSLAKMQIARQRNGLLFTLALSLSLFTTSARLFPTNETKLNKIKYFSLHSAATTIRRRRPRRRRLNDSLNDSQPLWRLASLLLPRWTFNDRASAAALYAAL